VWSWICLGGRDIEKKDLVSNILLGYFPFLMFPCAPFAMLDLMASLIPKRKSLIYFEMTILYLEAGFRAAEWP